MTDDSSHLDGAYAAFGCVKDQASRSRRQDRFLRLQERINSGKIPYDNTDDEGKPSSEPGQFDMPLLPRIKL
jgi:hypothetical protein